MSIIKASHFSELLFVDVELALRALIARLEVNKDNFEQKITELFYIKNLNELRSMVGIQQMPLIPALYYGL